MTPSAYLGFVEGELIRKIMARLAVLIGHRERMLAAPHAKDKARVNEHSSTQRAEMVKMWASVQAIHRFCPVFISQVQLPVLDFSRPPAELIQLLHSAFAHTSHGSVVLTGFTDLRAIAGARLLRAWEQRSVGKFAIFTARAYWVKQVAVLEARSRDLLAIVVPEASAAAAAEPPAAPRVAEYTAPTAAPTPACHCAVVQHAVQGHARALILLRDVQAAFAYVTSSTFTTEALHCAAGATRRRLASWSGQKGVMFSAVASGPGGGGGDTLQFGAARPRWAGAVYLPGDDA